MRYLATLLIAVALLMVLSSRADAGLVEQLRTGNSYIRSTLEPSSWEKDNFRKYMREQDSTPDFKVYVTWKTWIQIWSGASSAEQAIDSMFEYCRERDRKCRIYAIGETVVAGYSQNKLADVIEAYNLRVSGIKPTTSTKREFERDKVNETVAAVARQQPKSTTQSGGLNILDAPYVTLKNANVRERPDIESGRVTMLAKGTHVTALGRVENGNWYLVARDGEKLGYVFGSFIAETE